MKTPPNLIKRFINLKNLQTIKENIIQHSPHPQKVKIVAVTKTLSYSAIQSAEKNKIFEIGESKVQETQQKTANHQLTPETCLHFIWRLQGNKAATAVKLYDVIQSVDSIKLLNKINNSAAKHNKTQKIFLQINTTKAPTQTGFQEDEIYHAAETAKKLTNIEPIGLMSIGAHTKNKQTIKESFQKTNDIKQEIQNRIEGRCQFLSIGMSQDYLLALQAGSTHLRLGTILFQKSHEH